MNPSSPQKIKSPDTPRRYLRSVMVSIAVHAWS
jgi:hypothetical protein